MGAHRSARADPSVAEDGRKVLRAGGTIERAVKIGMDGAREDDPIVLIVPPEGEPGMGIGDDGQGALDAP